ncbi:MAG TPA: hypothetical protein VJ691_08065 [Vicinamibacterales bacterium]|nr:hypothetical protein [Vicinamibacterales bacterium]
MLERISRLAAIAALAATLVAVQAQTAFAQSGNPNTNRLDVPVTGVVQNVGSFAGTFKISKFAIQDNTLVALGQLNGTITDTTGTVVRTIVTNVAMPVANASGGAAGGSCDDASAAQGCDILNLVLGPLHLDLLGLVIDLNQVILTITATTGAGDLLGNLLCAITGLLDAGSLGAQLVNLLNQLVGILAA